MMQFSQSQLVHYIRQEVAQVELFFIDGQMLFKSLDGRHPARCSLKLIRHRYLRE
jgi:hypothetical protein